MKKLKKFLKYFFITILLLAVIFFSLGIIFSTITYESKVNVNKPVETSFGVFTNAMKLSDWVIGLKGIGWISGGQNEIGSKWIFIVTQHGSDYKLTQTLKEFKKNELFVTNADNELFTDDVEVKFIPNGTSTDIVATSHLSGKNIFWKSAFVCAQSLLRKQDQEMYNKLKEVIEKEN
ncbi:MAG: hypothetical protein HY063_06905 [Bacteroidetes bacterium]|nr:hypothetical protein [Bacteroidota bacterium]